MSIDEFQRMYDDYIEIDIIRAQAEADKVNEEMGGKFVCPVEIDGKYCLMLKTAASFLKEHGIL